MTHFSGDDVFSQRRSASGFYFNSFSSVRMWGTELYAVLAE
jgi:hypothetical protein